MARPEFDRGAVADSQPMTRMLLTLQRSAEQETVLQQLMTRSRRRVRRTTTRGLTPEQFGKQFGPSDADVQAVTDWLTRQDSKCPKWRRDAGRLSSAETWRRCAIAFHTRFTSSP